MKKTSMLNYNKKQLNHPICKKQREKSIKENTVTSEEDRTQQDIKDKKK